MNKKLIKYYMLFKHLEIYPKEITKQIHIVVYANENLMMVLFILQKLEKVNNIGIF